MPPAGSVSSLEFLNPRGPGAQEDPGPSSWQEEKLLDDPLPAPALPHLLCSRYLLFMKLAALQLMQQKASKMETPTSLENGSLPSSEPKPEEPPGPEAGSEEEGGSASGLAKVKELAETIASDDGTGGTPVDARGALGLFWQLALAWGGSRPSPEGGWPMSLLGTRGRLGAAAPHQWSSRTAF